jgi:uncharacterized membrane protein YbjE (DUF340 family)
MKGSLIVVSFFVAGCLLGWFLNSYDVTLEFDATRYVLYLLMFQVGLSIGSDKNIIQILKNMRPKYLLVPLTTIVGTLSFSALAAFFLTQWTVFEYLAISSGFAYYSLSSILITELKTASLGVQLATELGTIALITNIIREVMTLLGAPLLVKYFGRLAPICAAGATSMVPHCQSLPDVRGKSLHSLPFFMVF